MMTNILAIDPGKMTGWATYNDGIFGSGELEFLAAVDYAHEWMYAHYQMGHPATVVCERFNVDRQTARTDTEVLWSIESIGALRYLAHRYDQSFGLENRSDAKTFGSDELLKMLGWYEPGMPHANDAARVLARTLSVSDVNLWKRLVLSSGFLTEDKQ